MKHEDTNNAKIVIKKNPYNYIYIMKYLFGVN